VHAGRERGAVNDDFGGLAGLEGELGIPFSPGGSGGKPVLADGFFGVGSGRRSGGHRVLLMGKRLVVLVCADEERL